MAVIKPEVNKPEVWTFPKGDFAPPKESQMYPGTFQHMITVLRDGEQHVHFANDKFKSALEAAGLRPGATFEVLLTKQGNANHYSFKPISGAGPSAGKSQTSAPRPAGSATFADISFAYRECLLAASAHLNELAGLEGQTPRLVDFAVIQSAAATLMIQADRAGCLPRAPKAAPNLDGEHTKAFLSWLTEYRNRPDIAPLWNGKADFGAFIQKVANLATMAEVAALNDPESYKQIQELVLAETANREAAKAPEVEGEIEVPY